MNQVWQIIVLLQWTITNTVLIKSTAAQRRTNLTILYLTDFQLTASTKTLFNNFEKKINNTGEDRSVKIRRQVLPQNSRTLWPILHELNDSFSWKESGIVILDVKEEKIKMISLLGRAGIVFDIRSRPTSQEKIFLKTINIKPSLTRLHEAVNKIFSEIGWTTMAEIDCYSQNKADIEIMQQALDTIKKNAFPFIFVKCLDNLEVVLKYGKKTGLTSSTYRWVFPGILNFKDISEYLPRNVIAIDLPGSSLKHDSAAEDESLFLKDVLSVLEITLRENSQKLTNENDWTSKKVTSGLRRYISNRTFPGYTGDVILDVEGRRSGEIYEIFELIRFNGEYQWLPIGSLERGNVNILFNQWKLDKNHKPAEVPILRVVTFFDPPYVKFVSKQPLSKGTCIIGHLCRQYTNVTYSNFSKMEYNDYCCTGLIIEFLARLEKDLGFRSVVHIVKDGKFGSNDPITHQWNGMIGELVRNEADMAISTLTITAKRSKVVDFTYPYLEVANGILVSTQPASHNMWEFVFLETFSVPLWLALFVTVQIVIVILWLAERLRKRRRFINDPYKRDNSISYAEIINYTWSLVFQKASEEVGPSTLGGRTVAALFAFCTIIACSSFTANLAAIKVSERAGISISGIHDSKFQNSNDDFKYGVLAASSTLDFFRDSNDPALQRIYQRLRHNVATDTSEGARKVAKREWTAYIDDIPLLNYQVSKQTECNLKIIGDPFFFSGYGIGLQKNSTWNTRLSLLITSLAHEGFFTNLQSKWLPTACGDSKQVTIDKMGVNDIGGAFLIVAFGCLACGVLLGVEYAVWKAIAAGGPTDEGNEKDVNQALNTLNKVFMLWDVGNTRKSPTQAEATLRNFRTLTQRRHLGDCASTTRELLEL